MCATRRVHHPCQVIGPVPEEQQEGTVYTHLPIVLPLLPLPVAHKPQPPPFLHAYASEMKFGRRKRRRSEWGGKIACMAARHTHRSNACVHGRMAMGHVWKCMAVTHDYTHTHTYTHTPLQILTTTRPWQQCFCIATTIWSPTTTPHFWGRRWHKIKRTGSLPHSLDLNHENRLTASLSWLQMKRQANHLTFWFVHDRAIARPEQIQHTVRWLKRVSTLLTSHHGMLHTQTEITKVTQPQQQVVCLWACDVRIQSALGLHHLNPSHTCTTTQRQVACDCSHVTLSQSLWN